MAAQHTVELTGVRLTRLPAGRAEGFVWLSFVGKGNALAFSGVHDERWRVRDHVVITWPDGAPAAVVSGGESGGDGISLFEITLRDTGETSLVLTYTDGDVVVGDEVIDIPA